MKLNLEPHEVTIILRALDKLPRCEVNALIRKIVEQDAEQKLNEAPPHEGGAFRHLIIGKEVQG